MSTVAGDFRAAVESNTACDGVRVGLIRVEGAEKTGMVLVDAFSGDTFCLEVDCGN